MKVNRRNFFGLSLSGGASAAANALPGAEQQPMLTAEILSDSIKGACAEIYETLRDIDALAGDVRKIASRPLMTKGMMSRMLKDPDKVTALKDFQGTQSAIAKSYTQLEELCASFGRKFGRALSYDDLFAHVSGPEEQECAWLMHDISTGNPLAEGVEIPEGVAVNFARPGDLRSLIVRCLQSAGNSEVSGVTTNWNRQLDLAHTMARNIDGFVQQVKKLEAHAAASCGEEDVFERVVHGSEMTEEILEKLIPGGMQKGIDAEQLAQVMEQVGDGSGPVNAYVEELKAVEQKRQDSIAKEKLSGQQRKREEQDNTVKRMQEKVTRLEQKDGGVFMPLADDAVVARKAIAVLRDITKDPQLQLQQAETLTSEMLPGHTWPQDGTVMAPTTRYHLVYGVELSHSQLEQVEKFMKEYPSVARQVKLGVFVVGNNEEIAR